MEKLADRIVIDPKVRHGKPIMMGTRIPGEIVLGSLAGGMKIGEICKEYGIKREDLVMIKQKYFTERVRGIVKDSKLSEWELDGV